jgi:hypothetical protein
VNVIPVDEHEDAAIAHAAEVRALLPHRSTV